MSECRYGSSLKEGKILLNTGTAVDQHSYSQGQQIMRKMAQLLRDVIIENDEVFCLQLRRACAEDRHIGCNKRYVHLDSWDLRGDFLILLLTIPAGSGF